MPKKSYKKILNIERQFDIQVGRRKELTNQIESKQNEIEELEKENEEIEKCIMLLDYLIQNTEGKIVELFQSTVSAGLKDIFDDSYGFRFSFKRHGKVSACDYEIKSKQFPQWADIRMCRGKSVHQVIAAVLRIILVKLDKESPDIVIFDEPLDGLEPWRKEIAGKFLKELCEKFGMQIIMVTHSQELIDAADKELKI